MKIRHIPSKYLAKRHIRRYFCNSLRNCADAKTNGSGNEDGNGSGNEDGNGSGNGNESGNEDGSGDAENRTKTETILWNIIFPNFRTR